MKRFLILGALSIALSALAIQDASAWINSNFGLGMNWSWQSGGNSLGWGFFRDGQPCGPDMVPTHVPVYSNRPCCCVANVPVQMAPQVFCQPGAAAPAPCPAPVPPAPCAPGAGLGFGPGGPPPGAPFAGPAAPFPTAGPAAPAQAFRYSYRPANGYYYGR